MKETQVMKPIDVYAADDVDIEMNYVDPNDKERDGLPVVLVFTGFNVKEKKELEKIGQSLNATVTETFDDSLTVSHVIAKAEPDGSKTAKRTWKFFQGIAWKKIIVNQSWLTDSFEAGYFLPEDQYEINKDDLSGVVHDGPKLSRLARKGSLLEGMNFLLVGFPSTYAEVKDLITSLGGTIQSQEMPVSSESIIIIPDGTNEEVTACLLQVQKLKIYHSLIDTMTIDWLYDSIVTYDVKDHDKYRVVLEDSDMKEDDSDDSEYIGESEPEEEDDSDDIGESEPEEEFSIVYEASLPQLNGVSIQQSSGKKRQLKVQSCIYCEELGTKISRHMERKHFNEPEVAKILILPKGSKERRNAWITLISKGNYNHNCKVLEKGTGTLIPKYRPRKDEEKEKEKYLPCAHCLAFFVATDLWKHQKSCPANNSQKLKHPVSEGRLLLPCDSAFSKELHQIVSKMRDDEITFTAKSDKTILQFGKRLCEKLGHLEHNHNYIAQRMRELARLMMAVQDIEPDVGQLEEIINPQKWETLLNAVKSVAGYDENTHGYAVPSLPLKLGHSLSKCAKILRNMATQENDSEKKQKADAFLNLYVDEWGERITSHALETLHTAKFNKPKLIPTVEDVTTFHKFLDSKLATILKRKSMKDYRELAEICLVQIILFNRKRSGEVERIKVAQIKSMYQSEEVDNEIKNSLSKFEVALLETHKRIEIRGKRGRKVPILFTNQMIKAIETLMEMRDSLGIKSEYLFMNKGCLLPLRGHDCMRKLANQCKPDLFHCMRSTNLRKQLATMSQILNLSLRDQDMLAKFMGHDLSVHREYYRLPESTLEIAKVAKILHSINEGKLSSVKDSTLDELQLENAEMDNETDEETDDEKTEPQEPREMVFGSGYCGDHPSKEPKQRRGCKRASAIRKPWTAVEKAAVKRQMSRFFSLKTLPKKKDCDLALQKEECLRNRTWRQIKDFVRNTNLKLFKH